MDLASLQNLGDILRLPAHGQHTAYIDLRDPQRARSFTAFELDRLISSVARGLISRGLKPRERIGIVAENCLEFVASYSAIMRMGAVAVPVNHKFPPSTIAHIFRDADIRLALCDRARQSLVPSGVPTIAFEGDYPDSFHSLLDSGPHITHIPNETALAEILYTSGSTAMPKGVPLSHKGQLWAISNRLERFSAIPPSERTVIVAPLYHMNGLYFTTVALANRIAVISLPRFDARRYLEVVAHYRCTQLSGIPTMFAMMTRHQDLIDRLDLGCVTDVSIGSAPLTDALLVKVQRLFPNAQIHNGFGTTEAGPRVFGPHPDGRRTPALALGYPEPEVDCELVDGRSHDEGVLALRTPALMNGYLNLPEVTAARMRKGWYITGDVMRRDTEGFYYFVGRADDMFVCGGENIYPGELEKLLEHHDQVAQAVVVPARDETKGQIPVAFIVPRAGTRPSVEDIKQFALANGPAFAHPRCVVFRDSLPESGTHKIDRAALIVEAERIAVAAGRSGTDGR